MAAESELRPSLLSTMGFVIKVCASVAAPVAVVGMLLLWFVRADHVRSAVADRSVTVAELVAVAFEGHLAAADDRGITVSDPAAVAASIESVVEPVLSSGVDVRVVGVDGVVAYSTSPAEIGERMGMVEIAPTALQGIPSGRRSDPVNDRQPVSYSVPVALDGVTRGAARVVVADDPVVAAATGRAADLTLPFAAAMVGAIALITPLCWTSLGQIRRQFRRTRVLAWSDNLTGLANRTQFRQRLDEAIAAADRTKDRVGLILLDLDGFKAINDRGGHAAGDRLLKRVAAALGEATRRNEIACRIGGDEFAVIAPRIEGQEELVALADRLHNQINLEVDFADGRKLRVTASLGLAMFPDDAHGADDLLNVADVGMYRVKAARKAQLRQLSKSGADPR